MAPPDQDAPGLPAAAARAARWFPWVAGAFLSLVLAGSVWVVPYLPTNDGPEWIFATYAENHYSDPGAPYRDALIPNLQFASRGMSVIYAPLETLLGWQRGLQVALSVVLLATAWGFMVLVRAIEPRRWAIGLLGFPLALSWEFYIGLWPFVVSSALGLFILALAVRLREPTWKGRSIIALLLLLQAVTHVFGAVLTGGAVLAVRVSRASRGKRLTEAGCVLLMGAPAAGILVACIAVSSSLVSSPLVRDFMRLPWRDVIAMLPRTIAPGPLFRALLVSFTVLGSAIVGTWSAWRTDARPDDRGVATAAALLLLLSVFAPYQIPGWQAFSPRFVPLGVTLALAVFPLERASRPIRAAAPGALFVASVAWLALSYPFHRRLVALCPDAIAGLDSPFNTKGQILSILFRATEQARYDHIRSEVPFLIPLRHMGSLYATVMGGVPATSFTGDPAVHAFSRRPSTRPLPEQTGLWTALTSSAFSHDLAYRNGVENQLAAFGVFYDEVVLFGAIPSDFALWSARGYVADRASTTTLVAHFVPCAIDVAMGLPAADPAPTFDVRVGEVNLLSDARVPAALGDDGLAHFALAPAPCGDVALRAHWEGSDRRCANANAEGEIMANITPGSRGVTCEGP